MSGYGKKITDWYFGNNDREKETPKGGATRVLYLCWNYTGKLCLSGFLFLLCCIPVITIPAALCAQNAYLGKIFRNGYGFDLSDYWKEFKSSLWKHLPAGHSPRGAGTPAPPHRPTPDAGGSRGKHK